MKDLRTVELDAIEAMKSLKEARDILYAWPKDAALKPRKAEKGLSPQETSQALSLVDMAIGRLEGLITYVALRPAEIGAKGGKKTAERGSEWFRQLAAKRKTRAGGRPRKSPHDGPTPGEVSK